MLIISYENSDLSLKNLSFTHYFSYLSMIYHGPTQRSRSDSMGDLLGGIIFKIALYAMKKAI